MQNVYLLFTTWNVSHNTYCGLSKALQKCLADQIFPWILSWWVFTMYIWIGIFEWALCQHLQSISAKAVQINGWSSVESQTHWDSLPRLV